MASFIPKILGSTYDYRESVIECLRKFKNEGNALTYAEDTRVEDPDRYTDLSRTQNAYRTFQEFYTLPSFLRKTQMYAYNLYNLGVPGGSKWGEALREMERPDHRSIDLDEIVINPKVFFAYLSRVWRTLSPEIKRVFYAVSAIRTLAVGSRYVEHSWECDHPNSKEIREGTISPENVRNLENTFGKLSITGPFSVATLKKMGIRTDPGVSRIHIPEWEIPVFSQMYIHKPDKTELFFLDPQYKVFFWIYLPKDYFEAILPLLNQNGVPRNVRKPRISDDLVEAVASRLPRDYTEYDLENAMDEVQSEGLLPDTEEYATEFKRLLRDMME